MKERVYNSLTYGRISEQKVFELIADSIESNPPDTFKIYIGTDSQQYSSTNVSNVIVLYRKGKGAIFFWLNGVEKKFHTLRDRMYHEATQSIQTGERLVKYLYNKDLDFKITIDIDIGENGPTSAFISEITGYVAAYGFDYRIKPDSLAASTVADRFTKRRR